MPRKRTAPRATARCSYYEGRSRCTRNGTGNPPLCGAHRVVVEEEAQRQNKTPAQRAGAAVGNIIDDFLSGRPFDPNHVKTAVSDFAWGIGGGYGDYRPDVGEPPRGNFRPPGGFKPPPGWFREEAPPPQQGPDARQVQAARRELGFGPADVLTEELIKDRRRVLAKKYHPDRSGGSLARMQAVNSAADLLIATLAKAA